MNGAPILNWWDLVTASGLLLAAGALSLALKLGLARRLFWAAGRTVVQLTAVGFVLRFVFEGERAGPKWTKKARVRGGRGQPERDQDGTGPGEFKPVFFRMGKRPKCGCGIILVPIWCPRANVAYGIFCICS